MHIYIYIYIYIYTQIYTYIYRYTYTHTYNPTHIYIRKNVCNLFRYAPHPDLVSRGNQSVESQLKSNNRFPQNAKH